MTNNDVLRRLRYTFDFSDSKMIELFKLAEADVSRSDISAWLKKDDDEGYAGCSDITLATFLNGLIIANRGKKDGPSPVPEKKLTNNIIFRKLKIALDLKNDDVLALLKLADITISNHELSAFFRRADHKHYRNCKDQILRNFLQGIQRKHRPTTS
ncbi:MAG: hypothetical protein COB89_07025 [Piscirickettsiaceae bacterium]|nr:MAG: hypothetical protein COB89_07025 [Piscirickettsiaceae bacterium]